jgi:hypothetical protein
MVHQYSDQFNIPCLSSHTFQLNNPTFSVNLQAVAHVSRFKLNLVRDNVNTSLWWIMTPILYSGVLYEALVL